MRLTRRRDLIPARRRPALYWAAAGLQATAVLFTVSRGAFVGLALGGLLLWALEWATYHRRVTE